MQEHFSAEFGWITTNKITRRISWGGTYRTISWRWWVYITVCAFSRLQRKDHAVSQCQYQSILLCFSGFQPVLVSVRQCYSILVSFSQCSSVLVTVNQCQSVLVGHCQLVSVSWSVLDSVSHYQFVSVSWPVLVGQCQLISVRHLFPSRRIDPFY